MQLDYHNDADWAKWNFEAMHMIHYRNDSLKELRAAHPDTSYKYQLPIPNLDMPLQVPTVAAGLKCEEMTMLDTPVRCHVIVCIHL